MTRRSCNVLVIGGGLAGVQAAEVAAQFVSDVLLVDKGPIGEAPATMRDASVLAAYLAQDAGGVSDWKSSRVSLGVGALPGSPRDTTAVQRGFAAYVEDIARHGSHLNDPALADFAAAGVYNRIGWLESYGLHVVRDPEGTYRGFPGPGHGLNRVLLIEESPREILERIRASAARFGVTCAEGLYVTRLLLAGGRVAGAYALDVRSGDPVVIETGAVLLAAGGADRLYRTDQSGTAGDGYRLALDAGAPLANLEFVAFGPEAGPEPEVPAGLVMILLGMGARLLHGDGSPVVTALPSPAQLAREVARATGRPGGAWLHTPGEVQATIADLPVFGPYRSALQRPLEIRLGGLGILGGVVHRAFSTDVDGLFVAGAVATGCHGADLLPGVDTSFTLYSAENAATAAATYWSSTTPARVPEDGVRAEDKRLAAMRSGPPPSGGRRRAEMEEAVRRIMWEQAGPERTGRGLGEALRRLHDLESELDTLSAGTGRELVSLCELQALVATAQLVCRAALAREESLGQHLRADFPASGDGSGRAWITVRQRSGTLAWRRVPVPG